MTKDAKKPAKKKKLTLDKETVRKLTDKDLGGVAGGMKAQPGKTTEGCNSIQTCNMKCQTDPSACGC
jgi:hypothetical protein